MGDPVHDVVVPVGGREQGRILRQRQRRQGRRKNEPTQRTNESLRPGWRGTGTPGAPATGRGGGEGHKRGVPGVGGVRVRGVDAAVGVFLGAVASFSFFLVVWMSSKSSLLVMDAMFLATYPHLSSAHHDPREPKKGKVMVKGQKKCNILWILTF